MFNKLSAIERTAAVIISLAAVLGILNAGYQHFMTRSAAHNEHDEIVQQIVENQNTYLTREKNDRIDRHDREISRLERDLQTKEMPQAEQQFIQRELLRLENLKECIREEKC